MFEGFVNGQAQGHVAQALQNKGLNVHNFRPFVGKDGMPYVNQVTKDENGEIQVFAVPAMVANATLRRDEWKDLDMAVMKAARERLVGIEDLRSRGLTFNLTNGMGRTVLEYHDMDDPGSAQVSMDGINRDQADTPNFTTNYLPLPIIHADFHYNERVLQVSRNMGDPLDVSMGEAAARRVAEQMENYLFTSTSFTYGGGTMYTYLSHPHRNTGSLTGNWDSSAQEPWVILKDILNMKQDSINAKHYGPWMLYIPTAYETVLDEDYARTADAGARTVRERILAIDGIDGIKVADTLTANNVLLVEMSSQTVRLVEGMAVSPVQWSTEGGMLHNYKVMTISVPQIRSDQYQKCGIVHYS